MKRAAGARRDRLGVLRGRPPLDPMVDSAVAPAGHRSAGEVRELLRLVDRGLLSDEEFESQMVRRYALAPESTDFRRA